MKTLHKSESSRVVCGVCGGLADYFGIDPTIVRIICALIMFSTGIGIPAYLIAALIMPRGE